MTITLGRLAAVAGLLLAAGSPALADCKLAKVAEIPVTMVGMQPTMDAKINGKDATFLIDSGAFYSILDYDFAAGMGLKPYGGGGLMQGAGGVKAYTIYHVANFQFGGASVSKADFAVTQLFDESMDGYLGENILGQGDVEYDFANGVARLFRPEGCGPNDDLGYWAKGTAAVIPLQHTAKLTAPSFTDESRWLRAQAAINGQPVNVMFDTGATRSILKQSAAARAGVTPTSPGVTSEGGSTGPGGRYIPRWRGQFKTLALGEEQIGNVPIEFGDIDLGADDMVLGADFFLSHRIYVANSQARIYLTYNGGPVFTDGLGGAKAAALPRADDNDAPKDADGLRRRGAAFLARDDFARAIADLDKSIALAPEAKTFVQRGRAHLGAKQPELADADFDEAVKLDPSNFHIRLTRASRHLEAQRFEAARADFDAVLTLRKTDDTTVITVAYLYLDAGRAVDALPMLDRWLAAKPAGKRPPQGLYLRCRARTLLKQDLDKALSDCNEALDAYPRQPDVLEGRALARLRRGELDLALADYDGAIKLQPQAPSALYARGAARLKKGLKAEGEADLAAAKKLNPKIGEQARKAGVVEPDFDLPPAATSEAGIARVRASSN
jgi:tetratricopeptide (TPR) repeat protein/predicted aspartyl protease